MKHIAPALVLLLSLTAAIARSASPYEAQWREVDAAVAKGLPKTVIAKLEPLARQAVADRAYAEAVRAICTRIALEGNIEGNKPEEKVTRLRTAITNAPAPMRPVLDTCPRASTSLNTRCAWSIAAVIRAGWPKRNACMRRSSTAIPKAAS